MKFSTRHLLVVSGSYPGKGQIDHVQHTSGTRGVYNDGDYFIYTGGGGSAGPRLSEHDCSALCPRLYLRVTLRNADAKQTQCRSPPSECAVSF
ncbi:hypothetical protein EVAR_13930_1 [Eumeta japonica]|uniref:Uncharacterized protein n=1 Tax=Eumeta variegata TaxID=151549 RepID=A0A4C1U973_EUMVA|nr:hypothetical protein EVAR_13930_1 [Eumeta japonica]